MCSARPIRGQLGAPVGMLLTCPQLSQSNQNGRKRDSPPLPFPKGVLVAQDHSNGKINIYLQDNFMLMLLAKLVIE